MSRSLLIVKVLLNLVFLLRETELLQLAQNETKVTLAVHQLKTTCLSEAWRLLHIRLTVTGVLNSDGLFPLKKSLSIVWDYFGYTKNDWGVI